MNTKQPLTHFRFFNDVRVIYQQAKYEFEKYFPDGIKVPHYSVINYLERVGEAQTPTQLAYVSQVPIATMTRTLAYLEEQGLIAVLPNHEDKRSKLISLTGLGRKLRENAVAAREQFLTCVSNEFPVERLEKVMPLLGEVRAFLEDNRKNG